MQIPSYDVPTSHLEDIGDDIEKVLREYRDMVFGIVLAEPVFNDLKLEVNEKISQHEPPKTFVSKQRAQRHRLIPPDVFIKLLHVSNVRKVVDYPLFLLKFLFCHYIEQVFFLKSFNDVIQATINSQTAPLPYLLRYRHL